MNQHVKFIVGSMYRALTAPQVPAHHPVWKLKISLKIKIFIWYLVKNIALTNDNLAKKQWKCSLKCCGYNLNESIQHLLFLLA
jgi:hypothetical protein